MSWLDGLRHRLTTVLFPGRHALELQEEMQAHEDLLRVNGTDPVGSRAFVNRTQYREEVRAFTWIRFVDVVQQDARTAWRGVWHAKASLALVIVTLAVGIGATAAVFAILDALYWRPPAGVAAPGSVERYWIQHFRTGDGKPFTSLALTYGMARALAGDSGDVRRLGLYATDGALRLGREPGGSTVRGVYANAAYFQTLGVRPLIGRFYTADEDRMGAGEHVIVLSEAFWRREFGAKMDVIGGTIDIGRERFTVIGVTGGKFAGVELQAADVWIPLSVHPGEPNWWEGSNVYRFRAVALRSTTRSPQEVEARLTAALQAHYATRDRGPRDTLARVWVGELQEARGPARGPARSGSELQLAIRLGGVCALVLLLAWSNVVNILLARAARRRREFSLRTALGVGRTRLLRLLALEATGVALLSTACALVIAWVTGSVLRSLLFPEVTWYGAIVDWRVGAFALALGLLAGITAGLLPMRHALDLQVVTGLKSREGGNSAYSSRARRGLLALQAALSVVLVTGAALTVVSLRNIEGLDIGFDRARLIFGLVSFEEGQAPPRAVSAASARDIVARLTNDPAIERVARAGYEPMMSISFNEFFTDRDSAGSFPGKEPTALYVSPSFFQTVGLAVLTGQGFSGGDVDGGGREVVVNEAMARDYWPAGDAVGRCIWFEARTNPCYVVTGVVETARQSALLEEPRPQYYLPLGAPPSGAPSGRVIVVRALPGGERAATERLKQELKTAFPLGAVQVRPMTKTLEAEFRPWRRAALIFSALGVLALIVAVIGTYGSVSYEAGQRTRELGVRSALGGTRYELTRTVLAGPLRAVGVGVVGGVVMAVLSSRLAQALLYGVSGTDVRVLAGVSLVLMVAAVFGCLAPALRATRVDPITVLRSD